RPVELRLPADVIVLARVERRAVLADPLLLRLVARVDEDLLGVPVLDLPLQVVAALDEQDPFSGRREPESKRAATCAGADDDHVEVVHAGLLGQSDGRAPGAGRAAE